MGSGEVLLGELDGWRVASYLAQGVQQVKSL